MACDFPLPDIERARTIIDALGAMVVGEPCPSRGPSRRLLSPRARRSECCTISVAPNRSA